MKIKGQAILEFAFVMVVLIFLIYGIVQVAHWTLITTAEESKKTSVLSGTAHTLSTEIDVEDPHLADLRDYLSGAGHRLTTESDSMQTASKPLDMILQKEEE